MRGGWTACSSLRFVWIDCAIFADRTTPRYKDDDNTEICIVCGCWNNVAQCIW